MYNQERKLEFVEKNLNDVINERFLRQMEEWEVAFGKDCCDFTVNEIIAILKSRRSVSVESLNFFANTLKRYTDWCLKNGWVIDNQNHYAEISNDILSNCVTQIVSDDRIVTRKDIIGWRNSLNNISDATLLLALFEGICGKNMDELVKLSVDCFKGNTVKLSSGREFEVSTTLVEWCKESQEEETYVPYLNKVNDFAKHRYIPSDTVFKAMNTSTVGLNRKALYNKLIRIKNYLGLSYISTHSLLQSGRIEMIQKFIEQGRTLDEVLDMRLTEERYGRIQNRTLWKKNFGSYI